MAVGACVPPAPACPVPLTRICSFVVAAALLSSCAGSSHPAVPGDGRSGIIDVQILAFNDFHGNLEPPSGANGRVNNTEVGGVEYLAAHIAQLEATNPNTVVVSAGDNIGASPLVSALFHDEPTIEALGTLGLDFSTVGNHEFDEGWRELLRMQRGGCHPVDGCRGSQPFTGATFSYLSANVRVNGSNNTLFPATAMREFDGVPIGFIGIALSSTPSLVSPDAVDGITFLPESDAANAAARELRKQGAAAVVVLIHQGGYIAANDDERCATLTGEFVTLLDQMSADIDVVVSGHTNRTYACKTRGKVVTSTASFSRFITDIDLKVDRVSRRVVSSSVRTVPATRDVPRDPAQTTLLERYRPLAAKVGSRQVGSVSGTIVRAVNGSGEAQMGDVVADAFLTVARPEERGGAQIGMTNWGSLRTDFVHPAGASAATPHQLTYGDVANLMPFGNTIIVKTLTGEQLWQILEQQFDNPGPGLITILQVSNNVRYRYDPARPAGTRINHASITIDGRPLVPAQNYRVATSDFVWDGGDAFSLARSGTNPVVVGADIDVFLEYLAAHSPIGPGPLDRITREP